MNPQKIGSATAHGAGMASRSLTDEDIAKQKGFYDTRVKHYKMEALLADLLPLLTPHSESNIIVLTGATGVGKSTLTKRLLSRLIQDFTGVVQKDPGAVPLAYVEAYADGDARFSFKGLYRSLLNELQDPGTDNKCSLEVNDGKLVIKPQASRTTSVLRSALEDALKLRKTQVVVVDEAYHLLRFGKLTAVMDTLKSLANTTGVKLVLVGSFDLFDLVSDHGQVARRTAILNLDRYHIDDVEDCKQFKKVVEMLQAKWPCETVPQFTAIADELLEVSLGCVGLLKSLMLDASAMQLHNKGVWDHRFLSKAAKSNKLREVIRKEIEIGESKVRDALYGESLWDSAKVLELATRMELANV